MGATGDITSITHQTCQVMTLTVGVFRLVELSGSRCQVSKQFVGN